MQKCLITGSGGMICANLLRKAIYEKQPYRFASVDKITKGSVSSNIYINRDHAFYLGDISDEHFTNVLFEHEKPEVVIHGAAEATDPKQFIQDNIVGTQTIIDACLKWGIKKLIYLSDDKVYGRLINENEQTWKETDMLNPRNFYSVSKMASEKLIKAACNQFSLNYNIIRLSNNYGPRQTSDRFIPKAIKCISNNQPIPLYDQGLETRDWTYVADSCSAILTILNSGISNEIYNVSSGQEFSVLEVTQKICNIMGKGHDLISFLEHPGPEWSQRRAMDSSKIRSLNWKPEYKLTDGLNETISWYNKNQWAIR